MAEPTATDGLTTEPSLVVEAGMHTAIIKSLDVDAAGRFLVTASDDKTVRVWAAEDGRLLRTLRLPAGPGNLGKANAVAIAPDGTLIAASGWTSAAGVDTNIYLFDRATGRVLHRIAGLPIVVNRLAFSPDGRRLVAALWDANGVRLFDPASGRLLAEDRDYGGGSYGAAFDHGGRIATTSEDGMVRLYDPELKLLRMVPARREPFGVAFAPDGTRLALGYHDTTGVDVLDGRTLAPLFQADTQGVDNGNLSTVTWSTDGFLLACGQWQVAGRHPVRRWAEGGRGGFVDWSLSDNTLMALRPLPDGSLAFASQDPRLGLVDAAGRPAWQQEPPIADFRGQWDVLAVAGDGRTVRFGYEVSGREPVAFSLGQRRLGPADPGLRLATASTEAPGLEVTDWRHTYDPKLNGQRLPLQPSDISRSLAIAPDGERFLLGTEWWLRAWRRDGSELWPQRPAPGIAWVVTITPDGRLAVAAYGDGTIRWHRMSDGEELLAFFPHVDRERWVVWTPAGYYMASPGGEDLIGWQVNRGFDEAPEWYSASRFRDRFYRPDVIDLVLETLDVDEALARADAARPGSRTPPALIVAERNDESFGELHPPIAYRWEESAPQGTSTSGEVVRASRPPLVMIIEPGPEADIEDDDLDFRYRIEAPADSPADLLKALLDGDKVLELALPPTLPTREGRNFLPLTPAASQLMLLARNAHGWSDAATVRFRRRSSAPAPAPAKPVLHVLAAGVSQYRHHAELELRFAAADAEAFAEAWETQKQSLFREVSVQPLVEEDATREAILRGLQAIEKQMGKDDVAAVLFSGHGRCDRYGRLCLLAHDVDGSEDLRLRDTAVRFGDVEDSLGVLAERGTVLFFIDACHSGAALPGAGTGPFDVDLAANRLADPERGVFVFAACTGTQVALEKPGWQHGAFTTALLEAFRGGAGTDAAGCIRVTDLEIYVKHRVSELTDGLQTPRVLTPKERITNPRLYQPL